MIHSNTVQELITRQIGSVERVAMAMGICGSGLRSKLHDRTPWTVSDIRALTPILHLAEEQIMSIWFR